MVKVDGYWRRTKKGKRHYVSSYNQNRKLNRGRKGKLNINREGTGTYWLKGKRGRFVGRADNQLQTSARNIKVLGKDTTNIYQEKKPARIYGRTKGKTKSRIYR